METEGAPSTTTHKRVPPVPPFLLQVDMGSGRPDAKMRKLDSQPPTVDVNEASTTAVGAVAVIQWSPHSDDDEE